MSVMYFLPTWHAHSQQPPVGVCLSSVPFYAHQTDDGSWTGIWPALLSKMFIEAGLEYRLEFLPRARCTQTAAVGAVENIEIAAGRIISQERLKQFRPISMFRHFGIMFYSTRQFPDGLKNLQTGKPVRNLKDLKSHNLCGFQGWSYYHYENFGDFEKEQLPQLLIAESAPGNKFARALEMIAADRCSVVEMPGASLMSINESHDFFKDIGCVKLEGDPGTVINMLISRQSSRADLLALKLYEAATVLNENREFSRVLNAELRALDYSKYPEAIRECLIKGTIPLID